ncbi:hypothetical protein D9758_001647 [Tetrapyrgos nigripes]|uniref:DUF6533 domain-containing protein n=1 Tax=Tetrapyrgos nigripes TaxID=182062 RepID=A0A8H5GY99_9AGAR|nr:hypothetical protein D9758_001647 [Tetrapyrgos nigripes]
MSGMSAVNWVAAQSVSQDPVTTETIATALGLVHVLQVYTSCMVTLAVWDWLICWRMEVELIWKREWSMIKVLYLWTRYYGLVAFAINLWLFNAEFTESQCKSLHYLIAATCMWVTLGSESILAIRTYAFLGRKLLVGLALGAMLLAEAAFLLYVAIKGVYQVPPALGSTGPCTATDEPGRHVVTGFWIAPVVFDLICTFLTMYKAVSMERHHGVKSHIVRVFLREGLLYFLAVATVNVINAAFMFQSNVNIQNINCFLALVLSQVLCCRMVLSLRGSNQANPTTTESVGHTFAHPAPPSRNNAIRSGFSIPLSRFENGYESSENYPGVKVQVDVERDVDADEPPTKRSHHQ